MEEELYIPQITPGMGPGWRARVLVEEKYNAIDTSNGSRHIKLVLRDEQGNKVQGIIWQTEMHSLRNFLHPFKTYRVGGAHVQNIKPEFVANANGLTIQWVFRRTNVIKLVSEREKEIPYPPVHVTPFAEIPQCLHRQKPIDIIAAVVEVRNPRSVNLPRGLTPVLDVIVVAQDLKPMVLALWGDIARNQGEQLIAIRNTMPVILCKRLKASTFNGLSLGTNASSFVAINPNIPQAREFQNWANNHADLIRSAVNEDNSENYNPVLAYNPQDEITPVAYLDEKTKNSRVKVQMKFAHINQQFYFIACPKCVYRTSAFHGEQFHCLSCDTDQVAVPRCKALVELIDSSGSIKAIMFERNAEKLLNESAEKICLMKPQDVHAMVKSAEERIKNLEIIAEIKTNKRNYGKAPSQYTIQSWFSKHEAQSIQRSANALYLPATAEEKHDAESSTNTKPSTNLSPDGNNSWESNEIDHMETDCNNNEGSGNFTSRSTYKKPKLKIN